MSPLSKAKGIMMSMPKDEESSGGDYDDESIRSEIATAAQEGDWEGMSQAIAAYVDACMARKGE